MEGDNLIQEEVVVAVAGALKAVEQLSKAVEDLAGKVDGLTKTDKKDEQQKKKSSDATKKHTKETKALATALNKAKSSALGFVNALKGINKINIGSVVNNASKLGKKLYDFLGASINASEQLNMFNVVFGNIKKNGEETFSDLGLRATRFQNQLNELFSTNKAETMKFQALFQSLAVNTGVQADVAEQMSERMLLLTYDLASLYNKNEEDVAKAIQSGVYAGQTRPMRQVGIDLTQNNLGVTLQELGITDRAVSDMSQAEKQVLRYITAVRSASSANMDFANTINSPANQIKMLKQQFTELSVAIGNLFMRAFANILPYVNAIIMVVKEVLKTIALLFGIETEDYNESVGSIGDLAEGYDDVGDSASDATKAVKELKRQTLSFDQINNLTSPSKSGSSGGGGTGGVSFGAIDQRLLDALDKYDLKLGDVHNKAREIRDFIMEWLGFTKEIDEVTGEVTFKFGLINKSSVELAEYYGEKLADGLNQLTEKVDFEGIGRKIANGLNTSMTFVNTFIEEYDFEYLGEKIADGISSFFRDISGTEIGKSLTNMMRVVFEMLSSFVENFNWTDFGDTIGDAISSAIKNIKLVNIVKSAQGLVNGLLEAIESALYSLDVEDIIDEFMEAWDNIDLGKIGDRLSKALDALLKTVSEFLKNIDFFKLGSDLVSKLVDFITSIDWGALIVDTIRYLIEAKLAVFELSTGLLVGIVEGIIEIIVDALMDLPSIIESFVDGIIDFFAEIPERVLGFFISLGENIGNFLSGLWDKITGNVEEEEEEAEEIIDKWTAKMQEFRSESKKNLRVSQAQLDRTKELTVELEGLLDENGKVKEEEKTRAQVIMKQLNEALGLELTLGDDLIIKNGDEATSYENIRKEVEKLIVQKRINALMDAYLDEYKERLKQLADDQAKYNDLVKIYGENSRIAQFMGIDALKEHIKENENFVTSYENMEVVVEQGFDNMSSEHWAMVHEWEKASHTSLEGIMYTAEESDKFISETHRKMKEGIVNGGLEMASQLGVTQQQVDALKNTTINIKTKVTEDQTFKNFVSTVNGLRDKVVSVLGYTGKKAEGGIFKNGSWQPIQQYAYGGIPSTGQLFVAREAGPELVGRIGNSTAVMNNNQIVSSVASGVAQAVKGVMAGGTGAIEVYVHTDEGTVVDRINKITRKTGECPIQF